MANGNYWEKPQPNGYRGPLPNPNAPIPNAPTAPPPTNGLSAQDTDALLAFLSNPNNAAAVGQQMGDQVAGNISQNVAGGAAGGLPMVYDVNSQVTPDMRHVWQAVDNRPGKSIVDSMGSAVGDMWDSVSGIGRLVADQANQAEANDPMNILARLRQQYGSFQYDGPSAQTMVDREFNPQFDAIDNMAKGTEGRYAKNAKNLAGLYSAYANDVLSGREADAKTYAQGTKDINASYAAAQDNATKNQSALSNEMTQQLALLGQNEAAPAIMQDKQKQLADQQAALSQAQGAAAALNTQLGANAYAFDTAQHGIAKQAGINAQADLAGQLEDKMSGYDTQRLALQGNRGQALNNYDMMIQKLISEGNSGVGSQIDAAFKTIMGDRSAQSDRELQQARLDLDLQKFQASQQPNANVDTSKMNPYDALTNRAMGAYGDPQQASNATDILYQTGMLEPNAQNIKVLMDLLDKNNPGWSNDPTNRAMAYDYFSRILNANKRN